MTERVAIVGTREPGAETAEAVIALVRSLPEDAVVISGGAQGVDTIARDEALDRVLRVVVYYPAAARRAVEAGDPTAHISVRDALIARNTLIALACTRMVAFVRGSRGGTWDAVKQAERFERPVEIVR